MYMDAPARVVETAVDMMRYMKLHEDLSLRIGIATGKVLAGCMSAETPNFDVFGHAVNLASRIQGLAPVGGILLDAATCDQTSHLYNFAGPTTLEVKGIGPVDTFVWSQKRNFTEQ
jgi:class 3 adenylate cyclase